MADTPDLDSVATAARGLGYSEAIVDVIGILSEYTKTFDPKASIHDLIELLVARLDVLNRKGPTHA